MNVWLNVDSVSCVHTCEIVQVSRLGNVCVCVCVSVFGER